MIITAIVTSPNLGMQIRAGNVQSRTQLDFLQKANCHHVQGFLFSLLFPQRIFLPSSNNAKPEPSHNPVSKAPLTGENCFIISVVRYSANGQTNFTRLALLD
ncbi:MAG: hypothetical protein P0107_00645 [Nitrosomonas sp.]|nr:hypothetical protein [Nitrosomonas sp.]